MFINFCEMMYDVEHTGDCMGSVKWSMKRVAAYCTAASPHHTPPLHFAVNIRCCNSRSSWYSYCSCFIQSHTNSYKEKALNHPKNTQILKKKKKMYLRPRLYFCILFSLFVQLLLSSLTLRLGALYWWHVLGHSWAWIGLVRSKLGVG